MYNNIKYGFHKNFYRKFFVILFRDLMHMEHCNIYILKLILKINISETNRAIQLQFWILSIFMV